MRYITSLMLSYKASYRATYQTTTAATCLSYINERYIVVAPQNATIFIIVALYVAWFVVCSLATYDATSTLHERYMNASKALHRRYKNATKTLQDATDLVYVVRL